MENSSLLKNAPSAEFEKIEDQLKGSSKLANFSIFETKIIQSISNNNNKCIFEGLILIIVHQRKLKQPLENIPGFRKRLKILAKFGDATTQAETLHSGKLLLSLESSKSFLEVNRHHPNLYASPIIENLYEEVQTIVDFLSYLDESAYLTTTEEISLEKKDLAKKKLSKKRK